MEALLTYLDMGGYAPFVWPCFGLAAAVMLYFFVASRRELRQREQRLEVLRAASPRRRRDTIGQEAPS
ncbi:heme exporter protein CcmD [Algihabitans albus]|uniref:heme exporter protein CcmD n=1 Tax=Algihabitans albus TaxID=2164067 RepID=UPI000E5D97E7|nr:heme exporter protein CcmD [Algihabitans albus]